MQTITIINDWGGADYYLPILKAKIISLSYRLGYNNVSLVDISSQIRSFDILTMSFIIKNCFSDFPAGTLHLLGVNCEPSETNPMILAKYKGHYFLGIDDGRFSLIFDEEDAIGKEMPLPYKFSTFMFPEYASKAYETIEENNFENLPEANMKKLMKEMPVIGPSSITGRIIYIDAFGNAVSNITKQLFGKTLLSAMDRLGKNLKIEICIQGPYLKLYDIYENYEDVMPGEHIALFNSLNYLEFAINHGHFAGVESVDRNCEVTILFKI